MFDSSYYKKRIVYKLEADDYKAMIELNYSRKECYVFLPDEEKPGDYAIYLRSLENKPLDHNRVVGSLGSYLASCGYNDFDFANPFGRTKKVVNTLEYINQIEKDNVELHDKTK